MVAETGSLPPVSVVAFLAGFFFSFRTIIGLIAVRVLGMDARGGSGISLALNLLLLALICFYSLGAPRRSLTSMLRPGPVRWVAGFLAFSGISLFWTASASPAAALLYWSAMVADVLIVALLLRALSAESVVPSLMQGFLWSTCMAALLAWAMPAGADLRLGDEEFFNPNQIGFLCALAFYFAQYLRIRTGRWGWVAVFLGVTLVRSLSKTTLIAFAIAQGFLLLRDSSIKRETRRNVFILLLLLAVLFAGLFASYFQGYTSAGNQAETLTGRTAIWGYVGIASLERPWLGHGFDSMWKIVPPLGDGFEPRHAENEALQQFYAYGAMGLVLMAGLYGSFLRLVRKLPGKPMRLLMVSLVLFIVIRGLAEAEPFDFQLPLWMILLLSVPVQDCSALRQ